MSAVEGKKKKEKIYEVRNYYIDEKLFKLLSHN